MLKKFSVSNYRRFNQTIEFDLSASNYSFNTECVQNNLVKLSLIYGKNGAGKSNLAWALFDLVSHLTDNQNNLNKENYLNALSDDNYARFKFEFEFLDLSGNNKSLIYEYTKDKSANLTSEKLFIEQQEVVNYQVGQEFFTSLLGTENLNKKLNNSQKISAIKYIYSNTSLDKTNSHNEIFIKFIEYVSHILFFRSVVEGNSYLGYDSGGNDIEQEILEKNNLKDFERFLNDFDLNFQLVNVKQLNKQIIGAKIGDKVLPFFDIISTGTLSLTLFYYWWKNIQENQVPLLFIDEFDCAYHFELSEKIVQKLKELPSTQVILTTHNTNLLTNEIIRPDCGYIIDGQAIRALNKSTRKELREVHNLERLYQAGEFDNGK